MDDATFALLELLEPAPVPYRGDGRLTDFKQDDTIDEALHMGLVDLDRGFLEATEFGREQLAAARSARRGD